MPAKSIDNQPERGLGRRLLGGLIRDRLNTAQRNRRRLKRQSQSRPRAALIISPGGSNDHSHAIAVRAASAGLHVYVAGSNEERIHASVSTIGAGATPVVVDLSSLEQTTDMFARLARDGYDLELVVHSMGATSPRPFLETSAQILEQTWQRDTASGFNLSRHAISTMSEQGFGTLIFTGASMSLRGTAGFAAFAQAAAGLRMLAQSLAREFSHQGIHVIHITIDAPPNGGEFYNSAVADTYWQLHKQHPSSWTHELDMRSIRE